jgi:hypothetical protein
LASLADPARALAPMAGDSGVVARRDLCALPTDRANAADGVGAAIASLTDAPGIADEPVASGELVHSDLRDGVLRGAVAPTVVAPGVVGEPLNDEPVDGGAAVNRGRVLRALRALRTARALRLAIALGMAPGTGVE